MKAENPRLSLRSTAAQITHLALCGSLSVSVDEVYGLDLWQSFGVGFACFCRLQIYWTSVAAVLQ
jgi:hypothetical protein